MQLSGYNTKKMENMQLIFTAKCVQYFKEDWINGSTNTDCPMQLIVQKESHIKKPQNIITSQLERHILKKEIVIESGLTRLNENDVMLTLKKIEIGYFIAKEELPLTKSERILALEELHNIEPGNAYCNNNVWRIY